MILHKIFGKWRIGFCFSDWHFGLTTWGDGTWMRCFGPVSIYREGGDEARAEGE